MSASGERLDRLDDYLSGHMPEAEAARLEEDLFEAAADASDDGDVAFLDQLARMSAMLAAVDGLRGGGTRAMVDLVNKSGLRVHYVDLGAGGPVDYPAWANGTEIVVTRLGVDLRGWENANVEVSDADGKPVMTFRDVACDPDEGAVYAICQEPLARYFFLRSRTISRVVATRDGHRETLAVFDITPI